MRLKLAVVATALCCFAGVSLVSAACSYTGTGTSLSVESETSCYFLYEGAAGYGAAAGDACAADGGALAMLSSSAEVAAVSSGLEAVPGAAACLHLGSNSVYGYAAEAECGNVDGTLFRVDTAEKVAMVSKIMDETNLGEGVWIAGSNEGTGSDSTWVYPAAPPFYPAQAPFWTGSWGGGPMARSEPNNLDEERCVLFGDNDDTWRGALNAPCDDWPSGGLRPLCMVPDPEGTCLTRIQQPWVAPPPPPEPTCVHLSDATALGSGAEATCTALHSAATLYRVDSFQKIAIARLAMDELEAMDPGVVGAWIAGSRAATDSFEYPDGDPFFAASWFAEEPNDFKLSNNQLTNNPLARGQLEEDCVLFGNNVFGEYKRGAFDFDCGDAWYFSGVGKPLRSLCEMPMSVAASEGLSCAWPSTVWPPTETCVHLAPTEVEGADAEEVCANLPGGGTLLRVDSPAREAVAAAIVGADDLGVGVWIAGSNQGTGSDSTWVYPAAPPFYPEQAPFWTGSWGGGTGAQDEPNNLDEERCVLFGDNNGAWGGALNAPCTGWTRNGLVELRPLCEVPATGGATCTVADPLPPPDAACAVLDSLALEVAASPCSAFERSSALCEFCLGSAFRDPATGDCTACNMARGCGPGSDAPCGARQSTFLRLSNPPASAAVDADSSTCAFTANAIHDPNPQWVRVDLGLPRVVGTVRFRSVGGANATNFTVRVAMQDAGDGVDSSGNVHPNPTYGGELPASSDECAVAATAAEEVFEAACAHGTIGRFVFLLAAAPHQELAVCDVEAFRHHCLALPADTPVVCGEGLEPSACPSCRGCEPCAPGFYSDTTGSLQCTPCPGSPRPASPEGATSIFQCEGSQLLDGSSTLAVDAVAFNQSLGAWQVDVEFSQAPRIQVNGFSGLYMSAGDLSLRAATYHAASFPCKAAGSAGAGSDLAGRNAETACCLQDVREDYVMTKIFREYTDGLDLVAANDVCDGEEGSSILRNAGIEVVGAGSDFVDTAGEPFANPITVEPIAGPSSGARRAGPFFAGVQYARITIPDAELAKVSKSHNPGGNLEDSREIFIGLLDMLPTGTRVVDSSSQQISILLSRTQYGTFAAYGEQNVDYDFLSYLNARAHKVIAPTGGTDVDQYFLEVSYVYDSSLRPSIPDSPVLPDSVSAAFGSSVSVCKDANGDFRRVVAQACGPGDLLGPGWQSAAPDPDGQCPQVSTLDANFGRLYIPLDGWGGAAAASVAFTLSLTDAGGEYAELEVEVDIAVSEVVTWCDASTGGVDLTEAVAASFMIGTEASSPPRLFGDAIDSGAPDATDMSFAELDAGAETLQDALITLILDVPVGNESLEVFFEDVLVIHLNPGSDVSIDDLKDEGGAYWPTVQYRPDTRDAWMTVPSALEADGCPAADVSPSFFGCAHKLVVADGEVAKPDDAYLVGGGGAQDFMENMLGEGTATASARKLGAELEMFLSGEEVGVAGSKKVGLWVNPGHKWGQAVHDSAYSLSQYVMIHVLFGVRSGVDGATRRMLLSTEGGGATQMSKAFKFDVTAATLVEELVEDVVAVAVRARLEMPAEEACLPKAALLEACGERLRAGCSPFASSIKTVQCVSATVEAAACAGLRRAGSEVEVEVEAVIALDDSPGAFLDIEAVVASGAAGVLSMSRTESMWPQRPSTPARDAPEEQEGSSSMVMIIALCAGAAGGATLLVLLAWKFGRGCCAPQEPLAEVVESVPPALPAGQHESGRIEDILMFHKPAPAAAAAFVGPAPTARDSEGLGEPEVTMEDLFIRASTARRVGDAW